MSAHLSRRAVTGLMAATLASGAYLSQTVPKASAAVNSTSFTFTDSAGTSSSARFYPAGSVRTGLVVYLDCKDHPLHDQDHDGDNANLPGGLAGPGSIVEAATARGFDVVSVRTPSTDGSWVTTPTDVKITYLTELIQHVQSAYGANPAVLWLVGYAEGADFITMDFFPKYVNTMQDGGLLALGGGDGPTPPPIWGDNVSQHAKSTLSLNFVTGEKDETAYSGAINSAKIGVGYYEALGFEHVWSEWPAGLDHDSLVPEFGAYLGKVLDAHKG